MGVGTSIEEEARLAAAVHKLSKVELKYIERVFEDLSYVSEDGKRLIKRPTWLNSENFASKFGLPDFLGEQLFDAFDRDQNEVVDVNEFLMGMALCLHGSVKDKCRLLFKMFNLNDDEGISREELSTALISILQSTHGLLKNLTATDYEQGTIAFNMKINETVERIVRNAFDKCDTSRNGKLEIHEFEHWLHKNPKLFDNISTISCRKSIDGPEKYDIIASPVMPEQPSAFAVATEADQQQLKDQTATHLSDLFSDDIPDTKDLEGQMFFNTIGIQKDEFGQFAGTNEGMSAVTAPAVVDNTSPAMELRDPVVPELANDIIEHHKIHLNEEPIPASGSQMSLVSLGQSTGDLSSLDGEAVNAAEQGIQVSGPENGQQGTAENSAIDNVAPVSEVCIGAPEVGETFKDEDDSGEMPTVDEPSNIAGDDVGPIAWHPLQETASKGHSNVEVGDHADVDDEDEFQDACEHSSDVECSTEDVQVNINDSELDLGEVKPPSPPPGINRLVDLVNGASENKPAKVSENHLPESSIVDTEQLSDPAVDAPAIDDKNNSEFESALPGRNPDDGRSDFKELLVEPEGTVSPDRPENLSIAADNGLSKVDLSPSDHAIGKPTLRQLAEMKVFDTSPSLEEKKSVLSEARLTAWQPSLETRTLIEAVRRGNVIDKTRLTYPSVLLETSMGDPVKDLVAKFLGQQEAEKRPVPTADRVTMNDAGLRELLEAECWRGSVDWTAKYLTAHGQGLSSGSPTGPFNHTPKLLQIWFVRIALLFKLKSLSSAEAELNAFGDFDNPDLYYEYYPDLYPEMKGCLVPFSLRIIHAELPQHNGRPQESLDRLYRLLDVVKTVASNLENGLSEHGEENSISETERTGAMQLWNSRHTRILYSIGNCLLGSKEYTLALKIFNEIMKKNPETKSSIVSGVGRLHLQLGDINLAKKYFKKVEQISSGDPKTLSITVMNRGFVALAEGKYDEAFENFQSVTKLNPDNSSAWNNSAVCLLFLGKVKEASNLLENLIWKSPKQTLHEDIIFNMCTIYELETSRALQKKQKLLDLVSRHKGDGFNIQSLKLT
eukprot:gene4779-5406_t